MNGHEPSAPGRKRWFRYRLRTLLIAITLATIAFAWCRSQMIKARWQRELAAAVEAAGGTVYYDWENRTSPNRLWKLNVTLETLPMQQGSPPGPQWLREWIGDEYFQEIVEVDLIMTTAFIFSRLPTAVLDLIESADDNDDAKTIVPDDPPDDYDYEAEDRRLVAEERRLMNDVLQKIGRVPSVRYLYLGEGRYVDDAMLVPLKNLHKLEELDLSDQDITGEGLIHLSSLEKLRWLDLSGTPLSDAGLYHLREFKNLEYLDLGGTMITGRRLGYLRELPRLRELNLGHLRLIEDEEDEDAGDPQPAIFNQIYVKYPDYPDCTPPAEVLGQMTQLRVLRLYYTNLDDYTFLTKLSDLEELYVSGTDISREEIDRLKDLAKLKTLSLAQTRVGADQIASFAQLSSLEVLDVSATYIDDTACESLCRLKNLKVLFLHSSRVTTIGVARLKNAFPQLDLQGYPGRDPATIDSANVPIDDPNWIPPNIPMF